jgi:hypothetical protein
MKNRLRLTPAGNILKIDELYADIQFHMRQGRGKQEMAKDRRSADELVRRLLSDPEMWARAVENPAKELLQLAKEVDDQVPVATVLENDTMIYRMVVAIIGVVAVLAVIGAIVVVFVPEVEETTALLTALVSISSASIGALAGLLSPMGFRR